MCTRLSFQEICKYHHLEDNEEHDEDLRISPLQGGGVDVEQVLNLGLLSLVKVLNQVSSLVTLGPTRSILT